MKWLMMLAGASFIGMFCAVLDGSPLSLLLAMMLALLWGMLCSAFWSK